MSHATDWTTPAEAAHFKTTPDYIQTHAYLERLAAAAPQTIRLSRFGVSPEGRDLMLVVAASGGEFTPEAARKSGKQILMVQAGIHAGEIEGKDAGLMLLRDLSVAGKFAAPARSHDPALPADLQCRRSREFIALQSHQPERPGTDGFSRHRAEPQSQSRLLKADAPEMRDWLKLFNAWLPDLFVDVHTTDGADYQYDLPGTPRIGGRSMRGSRHGRTRR